MFIGYFPKRPYQDPQPGFFGDTGTPIKDLTFSNGVYGAELSARSCNRYLDEKIYAEEIGFGGLKLNEHHSTSFCMGGAMNVESSILRTADRGLQHHRQNLQDGDSQDSLCAWVQSGPAACSSGTATALWTTTTLRAA